MKFITALGFALKDLRNMHGSVTGPDHEQEIQKCTCVRGKAFKKLEELKNHYEIQAKIEKVHERFEA